jgi:hypothetical protein
VVAPVLAAAREWAHWSVQHGQLAPQFQEAVARASFYGGIVFALFLLNIPVAVWKPFSGLKLSRLVSRKMERTSTLHAEAGPDLPLALDGPSRKPSGQSPLASLDAGFGGLSVIALRGDGAEHLRQTSNKDQS